MKIVDNIIPRGWANTAFIVNCGFATMFWAILVMVAGALSGLLPRDLLRTAPSAQVGAGMSLLILVAAVMCTAIAVKVWRETGHGRG